VTYAKSFEKSKAVIYWLYYNKEYYNF